MHIICVVEIMLIGLLEFIESIESSSSCSNPYLLIIFIYRVDCIMTKTVWVASLKLKIFQYILVSIININPTSFGSYPEVPFVICQKTAFKITVQSML